MTELSQPTKIQASSPLLRPAVSPLSFPFFLLLFTQQLSSYLARFHTLVFLNVVLKSVHWALVMLENFMVVLHVLKKRKTLRVVLCNCLYFSQIVCRLMLGEGAAEPSVCLKSRGGMFGVPFG